MESGRVAALSIHQPISISIVSLFISSPPLFVPSRPPYARPLHFPSRSIERERAKSSVSNSRTSRSLCEYYSALHSRFSCRVMLYRDAPLHLRVKMSIRSCFSTGSFLHKFSVSLCRDLLSSFVRVVLCRLQESKGKTRRRYSRALGG